MAQQAVAELAEQLLLAERLVELAELILLQVMLVMRRAGAVEVPVPMVDLVLGLILGVRILLTLIMDRIILRDSLILSLIQMDRCNRVTLISLV
jgi:hypothetical protein